MQTVHIAHRDRFTSTARVDLRWRAPALTAVGLVVLFGYLTFRAFNATYVWYAPYISPTVAPPVFTPASGYPGAVPVDRAKVSPRYRLWKGSSWLNERHMAFAWFSLAWVVFTDVYIYLVSAGIIRDFNTW